MTVDQFLTVLALTESSDNPLAWGDYIGDPKLPEAMGRWQVHPAWFAEFSARVAPPGLHETWDSWVRRAITWFFHAHENSDSSVTLAMRFHLGHWSQPDQPDWDKVYADRFNHFAEVQGA